MQAAAPPEPARSTTLYGPSQLPRGPGCLYWSFKTIGAQAYPTRLPQLTFDYLARLAGEAFTSNEETALLGRKHFFHATWTLVHHRCLDKGAAAMEHIPACTQEVSACVRMSFHPSRVPAGTSDTLKRRGQAVTSLLPAAMIGSMTTYSEISL